MGSPVLRAEAHGDLEHLCVHHVGHHAQEACGEQRQASARGTPLPTLDTGGMDRRVNGYQRAGSGPREQWETYRDSART